MSAGIRFSDVSKTFRKTSAGDERRLLHNFSLTVEPGELIAFVGRSGIGKTTLLHLAAGFERPDSGSVETIGAHERTRVGMVFQQPRLLEWRTVWQNIQLAAAAAGVADDSCREFLAQVQLNGAEGRFPLSLSGGERQRVALARAFAIQPDVVLMDEPFSALDELTGRRLRELVQELWIRQKPTGLLITHNPMEAAFLADRVVVLGGHPCSISETIEIPVQRPRKPDDDVLFAYHRRIITALLSQNANDIKRFRT
jgi:NitT/TauT family transport system ATP-binding protein